MTGIPKLLIYGPHDDLYFAKAAHYIIHRQWMGPYDQYTLIKAPFYSLFMIFSFFTGLPLLFNETIFYLGACLFLFYALVPLIENRWWRLLLFILMLFAPASLATLWNVRVYREFVYFSLTLYVLACAIGLFLRLDQKIPQLLLWSTGLGLSMGAFMITREEGVWIYPMLFVLLFSCLLFVWLRPVNQRLLRSFLVLLPILLWQIPSSVVSYLNYSYYGFWGTTEQLDPDFNRVLNTLGRIQTNDSWHPAIRITEQARMQAYAVSPILHDMKDPIETAVVGWNLSDDSAMAGKPEWYLSEYGNGGNEISNGHFYWLLRDVVSSEGYYAKGQYPREFYRQLADQLEAACKDGRLNCSPPGKIPFIGSLDRRHYPIILRMFFENILHLLKQDYVRMATLDIRAWSAWPENNDYKYFEEFVYNSLDRPTIHSRKDPQYLVNGGLDIRLKILRHKERVMVITANLYKGFTWPASITGFVAWLYLLIGSISKRRRLSQGSYLLISSFVMGLFFTRLLTLTIVDAATTAAGMMYSDSIYLFIYMFSFLMIYWAFEQFRKGRRIAVEHSI